MWTGWPVERILYLILGIIFLAIFVQVTLFHLRQNFRHPAMWSPVIATPILGILSFMATGNPSQAIISLLAFFLSLGAVIGLVGTYFHIVGVGSRVQGYTLNNFMVGPPPVLPLTITVVSVLGLVIIYLL